MKAIFLVSGWLKGTASATVPFFILRNSDEVLLQKYGEKYLKVTTVDNEVVDAQWVDKIDEDEEVIYSKEE